MPHTESAPDDAIIIEVASDLTYVEQLESDFHYELAGDRITVQRWNEDGTTSEVLGHLTFQEIP